MENGLTEDKIDQLDQEENQFSSRERLALSFAEQMAVRHREVQDSFFEELRSEFSDPEIMELGMMIGQYIGFGRLLQVLDLEDKSCPI